MTKVRNILPMIWKQIQTPKIPWVPLLTAGEQTKLTWAKVLESYDAIPEVYRGFFEPFLADGQPLPYTVFTPSREGFLAKSTEKIISIFGQEIYVLERNESSFEAQYYPIDGISYVEVKAVLLASHIKINGITKQGISASSIIKFNSVGDYLFTPILKKIRHATADPMESRQSSELKKFDHLMRLNYKFMNYARRSLLAGEKVIQFVLQPEIRVPVVKILGKTYYKAVSPTQISILTDQELIVIHEDEPKSRAVGKYGGIWTYIQLNKIVSLTLNKKDNNLLALSIQLPESDKLEFLFQASARQELDQLLERFGELNARKQ